MKKSMIFPFILLVLFPLLNSCGGGGKPVTTLAVDMTEQKFTPDEYTVPSGAEITLDIKNSGKEYHEFTIMTFGSKAGEKFDKDGNSTEYWTIGLSPSESKTVTFTAPSKAGRYVIECGMPGHYQAGMVGVLYVK